MQPPVLSVVVPAFNEAARILSTINDIRHEMTRLGVDAELIVVDDGSVDETAAIVAQVAQSDVRVRLVRAAHAGKGATVRRGMLEAHGTWRFLADADLSMPISELERFLDAAAPAGDVDVIVGSREANGARRVGEPWSRHVIGRVFNWAVRMLVLQGIDDTQCGFKLFHRDRTRSIFEQQTIDGFGFDPEILFLAARRRLRIREVSVRWSHADDTKVRVIRDGFRMIADLVRIRLNEVAGKYGPAR